jgi:hypothetical protein
MSPGRPIPDIAQLSAEFMIPESVRFAVNLALSTHPRTLRHSALGPADGEASSLAPHRNPRPVGKYQRRIDLPILAVGLIWFGQSGSSGWLSPNPNRFDLRSVRPTAFHPGDGASAYPSSASGNPKSVNSDWG